MGSDISRKIYEAIDGINGSWEILPISCKKSKARFSNRCLSNRSIKLLVVRQWLYK